MAATSHDGVVTIVAMFSCSVLENRIDALFSVGTIKNATVSAQGGTGCFR
jgi:hypothetical protein